MDSDIFRASITTYSVPSLHAFFPLFRTHPQFSTISTRVCVRFRFLAMTKKYARHSLDVFFHYCGFNPRPRMYARPFATPDCYRARTQLKVGDPHTFGCGRMCSAGSGGQFGWCECCGIGCRNLEIFIFDFFNDDVENRYFLILCIFKDDFYVSVFEIPYSCLIILY